MNNIDAAIAQASQAAANIPAQNAAAQGQVPATVSQTATAVVPGQRMGLDDAMAGAVVVDDWLKVSEHGLQIGNKKPILEEIKVRIDMSPNGVSYTEAVKYGNPATYRKTHDRVITTDGATWAEALSQARAVDPRARPYKSADIQLELVDDIKLKDETLPAGTVLGHGFSTTGFKSWAKLVKQMTKDGADPSMDTIEVTVGYLEQTSNGNTWGILDFRDYKVVG